MNKHLSKVATLILGVMVVAVVAVSLPAPESPAGGIVPVVQNPCPDGLKPVAPGSLTCVPEAPARAPVAQPAAPAAPAAVCPAGLEPVAPGSLTCIPDMSVSQSPADPQPAAPTAPDGYRPVAPGSYTSIPDGD
jgi:hypothetical protein